MLGGLDLTHGDQSRTVFADCISHKLGCLSLTLCSQDCSLSFFLAFENDELGPFCHLLCNLLLLNGSCELRGELEVGDGDVVKQDAVFEGAFLKIIFDFFRHAFTHRDQLLGVVLSDGGFEDFIADRGNDSLVVILTDVGQDDW